MRRILFWTLLAFLWPGDHYSLIAQDLETTYDQVKNRLQDRAVKISGGLGFGAQMANISNAPARFDDLDWSFRAQLNIDLLGVNLPFSAFLSDRNRLYNLPSYQFVGVSPRYKWATLHAGDRSLNFNPYTFSNQQFRGVGTELTPGKWRVAAMYGRLNRLQLGDFNARQDLEARYRRTGWAGEVGYQNETFGLKGIVFGASDELPDDVPATSIRGLAPARNLVASVEGNVLIARKLRWSTTFANSFITDNTEAATLPDSLLTGPITGNASTSSEQALLSTLSFNTSKVNWQVSYERLSPNYRSLGTFYLTPDRENITAGSAFNIKDNKYTLSLNGGLQRSNLADNRARTQRRLIAQIAANARPTDRFSANLNLSNFNNTSRLRTFFDAATSTDSLFLAQVNRSGRLGFRLANRKDGLPGAWSLDLSLQDAQAIQDEELTTFQSTIYNAYLAYAGQLPAWRLTYRVQGLVGVTRSSGLDNRLISPSVVLVHSFDQDRTSLNLTGSYSVVDYEDRGDGSVLLLRLGLNLTVNESSTLQLRSQYTRRGIGDLPRFSEIIIALSYAWNFTS